MSEETFRPRKSLEQPTPEPLRPMEAVRNMAESVNGTQFVGPIPPQLQQAMAQQGVGPAAPMAHAASNETVTPRSGSSRLEDLISGIKNTTHHYREITLPSLGKFYDGTDGPQDGVIGIRAMTGEEEQILATPSLVKKGQAINMIFDRCIRGGYRSDRFLASDRIFLLIFLRGISYTKDYDVEIKCPVCNTKFTTAIDLDTGLDIKLCPESFGPTNLSGTLPTSGYRFTYRLPRGSDEMVVQNYREKKLKGFETAGQADDSVLHRTALLLNDIEGLTDKEELKVLIRKLPISDSTHLRNVVNDQSFGVDTKIGISCPACLEEFDTELPLEANFFFPRLKKETTPTSLA